MGSKVPIRTGRNLKRRGAILITFALSLVVMFGFMGLAMDVGRLYVARNEAQGFADSAALAAAVMLDGTGFAKAEAAAAGTYMTGNTAWKKNHFQTTAFAPGDYTVKFSATGADGSFQPSGAAPLNSRFVEVVATANVPMSLSMVLLGTNKSSSPARARAVAAQVLKTTFDDGLIPFAPKGHCTTDAASIAAGYTACVASPTNPNVYGVNMTKGQEYTIRWWGGTWPQSFDTNKKEVEPKPAWCAGDAVRNAPNTTKAFTGEVNDFPEQLYDLYDKKTLDGRGFFTSGQVNSANDYKMLVNGSMAGTIDLAFQFDGEEPQEVASVSKALEDRGAGTKVYVPVIDPVTGKILSFYEFILVGTYDTNKNWCAIYNGATVFGTGTTPVNQDGIYEVRLVR